MTKLNSQKGGCVSSILIAMLALVLGGIIGFLGGIYYQKYSDSHKQTKENFELSKNQKIALGLLSIPAIIIVIIIIIMIIKDQ
jgi:heme/copper-type cytochrome/quinol oxidase subunit 2